MSESNLVPIVVRARNLLDVIGISRSTAYTMAKDPNSDFPKPFKLMDGKRPVIAWDYAELKAWVEKKKAEARS